MRGEPRQARSPGPAGRPVAADPARRLRGQHRRGLSGSAGHGGAALRGAEEPADRGGRGAATPAAVRGPQSGRRPRPRGRARAERGLRADRAHRPDAGEMVPDQPDPIRAASSRRRRRDQAHDQPGRRSRARRRGDTERPLRCLLAGRRAQQRPGRGLAPLPGGAAGVHRGQQVRRRRRPDDADRPIGPGRADVQRRALHRRRHLPRHRRRVVAAGGRRCRGGLSPVPPESRRLRAHGDAAQPDGGPWASTSCTSCPTP